jgi:hypothetical protein
MGGWARFVVILRENLAALLRLVLISSLSTKLDHLHFPFICGCQGELDGEPKWQLPLFRGELSDGVAFVIVSAERKTIR